MDKVIVSGATGFIGTNLIAYLLEKKIKVIALVHNVDKIPEAFKNNSEIALYQCDLRELPSSAFLSMEDHIDVFYHLAWQGASGELRGDVDTQLENVRIAMSCYNFCKDRKIEKFITVGSIAENMNDSMLDQRNISTKLIYPLTKKYVYNLLRIHSGEDTTKLIWCTLCGVYGEGDNTPNLVNYTLHSFQRQITPEYGKADQLFDFVHVRDCVRALYLVGVHDNQHLDYYIGSGEPKMLKDYLICMKECYGKNADIRIGERADDGVRYEKSWFDSTKIQEDTGYVSEISFTEGIKKLLASLEARLY